MALTLDEEPEELSLSLNPIKVKISTDKYVTNAGVKSIQQIVVGGYAAVGETFTLSFKGMDITFTSAAAPDDSGYQFYDTAVNFQDYAQKLLETLAKNYYVNKYFDLVRVADTVTIGAKEVGTDLNISFDNDFSGWTFSTVTPGVNKSYNENFQVGLDLYIEEEKWSGEFKLVSRSFEVPVEPDSGDPYVIFDLSEFLRSYVLPEQKESITGMEICTENCKRYHYKVYESYGLPATPKEITTSDNFFVMYGALSQLEYSKSDYNHWFDYVDTVKPFLTWRKNRTTLTNEPHVLYWYNNHVRADVMGSPEWIRLYVLLYFSDNTTQEISVVSDSTSVIGEIVAFAAGHDTLDLAAYDPSKTIVAYDCYLKSQTGTICSDTVSFEIVEEKYIDRFFVFSNSISGYEILRTCGLGANEVLVEKTEFVRDIPKDAEKSLLHRQYLDGNHTWNFGGKVGTGGISTKTELLALISFAAPFEAFRYDDDFNLVPVKIKAEKIPVGNDEDYINGFEFEFSDAVTNNGYSALNV